LSTPVVFNGVTYPVPVQGDLNWGPNLTRYLVALGTYSLAPSGGLFTLTSDVNFGTSFGLFAKYFTSITTTPATAGVLRLAKTDAIEWRNNANSGNNILSVDSSDNLLYNGGSIPTGLGALTNGKIWIGSVGNLPVAQTLTGDVTVTNAGVTSIGAGVITNSQINAAAAIAYSKLNLTGQIVNTDIGSSASITYSKLALSNSIVNSDINSSAAIDASKIANGSISSTEFQYLDGVTSAIQTQLDAKGSGTVTSVSGTSNQIVSTGGATPVLSISPTLTLPGNLTLGPLAGVTLTDSTTHTIAFSVPSSVTSYGLVWPNAQASGTKVLQNDGAGNLSWASAGAGTVTSVSGTANQITSTGGTTPVLAIASPLTTPGAVTVTGNLTFTPTTAGIVGTTTNNNTAAGNVGEFVSSPYSGVSITNGQWGDGTSISLTAGDWDVTHILVFQGGAATAGQGMAGISITTGNSSTGLVAGDNLVFATFAALLNTSASVPSYRMSLSGTTTVYAKINNGSTGGTPAFEGRLSARRIR
jgi:hypothetical protein